jgi:hypothetical protein
MARGQRVASAVTGLGRLQTARFQRYSLPMRFEKVWAEQCGATKRIKRRFGVKSALDYLIGEKLTAFADAAEAHPEFAKELPRFLAAVCRIFNEYEIAGYLASRRPAARRKLRKLLYIR